LGSESLVVDLLGMQVKILCLNLWQGGNLLDEILAFLQEEKPDILLLQEVYNGHTTSWNRKFCSMDILREALSYPFESFAPAFLERTEFGKVDQGNAILSRFPILDTQIFFYDKPYAEREDTREYFEITPRNLQRAKIDINGRTIQVFNTQGVWGEDGNDNPRRLKMAQTIVEATAPYKGVVLAGDFNVQENTKSVEQIETHLVNVFANDPRITSFNMKHKTNPGFATAVVDLMFVSPDLHVKQAQQYDADVSDHLALSMMIEL